MSNRIYSFRLNRKDFENILKNNYQGLSVADEGFREDIESMLPILRDPNIDFLIIRDAEFVKDEQFRYAIRNVEGIPKLHFLFFNCSFPFLQFAKVRIENIWFYNCEIEGLSFQEDCYVSNIHFFGNCQANSFFIGGKSLIKNLEVNNCSINSPLQCKNATIENSNFVNCDFIKAIVLTEESRFSNITLNSCVTNTVSISKNTEGNNLLFISDSDCYDLLISVNASCKSILFDNSNNSRTVISDESYCGVFQIGNCSLMKHLRVEKKSEISELVITDKSVCSEIFFKDSAAKKVEISENYFSFYLYNSNLSLINISNCHLNELTWQAGTKGELYLTDSLINYLNFRRTAILKDATVSIIGSKIFIVQLVEFMVLGSFVLRNIEALPIAFDWNPSVEIKNKKLNEVIEQEYISHLHVLNDNFTLTPLFQIAYSSLGKSEITGSNLSSFHLEYRDSKILELFLSDTKVQKDNIGIYKKNEIENGYDAHQQKASIYNQLKKVYENQGDVVEATWYHSKSMEHQKQILSKRFKEKKQNYLKKILSEEAFDLFSFKLNRLSNNHGESWRKALIFTLILLPIIYTLYFISVNHDSKFSWSETGYFLGNFFPFVDLTHKADFMVEKSALTNLSKFFDFIGRIATGYCIFQFVAAFRRHGRKGN